MDGGRPNWGILEELRFPPRIIQRGGGQFLLYDGGAFLGDDSYLRGPRVRTGPWSGACLGAVGKFKTHPRFRPNVYTAHAHRSGFATSRLYAILPNKTAATHAAMWAAIRANIGQATADVDRLVTMDFEVGAIGAAPEDFPGIRSECFYFHLG